MPYRSPRPCRNNAGHLTTARDGLCDLCRRKANARYAERRRGSETDDAYYHSAEWKRLRDEHLQMEPLCRRHAERGEVKAVLGVKDGGGVNHIVPRRLGGADSHENLETLCGPHMTSADARGVVARRR
jgi:5-methylcytosine-specific restriction endonuclease McrA